MVTNTRRLLLALTGVATVVAGLLPDEALALERGHRRQSRGVTVQSRPLPTPMLAVVALKEQHVTIYDSTGARMLESPVSSGTDGYETPPGVFSVVQKELEHHSNLYDDASMPFMQRITWTGIALHAGALPGYPASHGCVRLPHNFAEKLYDLTKVGMRVVVAREGIAPVAIAEPALFKRNAKTVRTDGAEATLQLTTARSDELAPGRDSAPAQMEARYAALTNAADEANRAARQARSVAGRAKAAAQPAEKALAKAEAALAKAEAELKAVEKKLLEADLPSKRREDAEKAKAAVLARIEAARVTLEKARGEANAKLDAVREAEEKAAAAGTAHLQALEAAEQAKQNMSPVSVLVSRKTQRIYVRKAFQPLLEGPVEIRDADKPIGTFVLTANEPAEGSRELRWSALSLYRNPTAIEPPVPRVRGKGGKSAPAPAEIPVTDAAAAGAALDRLVVPAEIAERVSEVVLPGSSLIITDEPPSIETGKDTDFVVVMSGEPKGGLAIREHAKPERSYDDDDGRRDQRRARPSGGGSVFGFWFN